MKVTCSNDEYKEMQKEVCYDMNELKQLSDIICSPRSISDYTLQANATYSAQVICDRLKNFLVQMNFITSTIANYGGAIDESNNNMESIDSGDTSSCESGDNMELPCVEEGNNSILEDSEPELIEEGNQEDIEVIE